MKKKHLFLLIFINLLIAIGYFFENNGVGFTQLSSDLHNSIPVCYKLDDPSLFKNDLYLHNVENVKYYTPFFIQTIRFFAYLSGDYLLGINIFATILHIVYGLGWFLLFYKVYRRFSIALFLSIIVRGIVWLPGLEIWGISDLWTMMPRTMYAAFMPFPFLLLLYRTKLTFFLACFLIGFIFNLHPITGMGGLWLFMALIILGVYFYKIKIEIKYYAFGFLLLIIGMVPFLSTYFLMTDTLVKYDIEEYKEAFSARIPNFFNDPIQFLELWLRFKTLFFLIPVIIYFLYGFFVDSIHKKRAFILVLLSLTTIIIFSISIYVESIFNNLFGLNLRMSFQIIRAQKLAILPGYFALGFLLLIVLSKLKEKSYLLTISLVLIIIGIGFSKEKVFKNVPFLGDDIATSIFPDYSQIYLSSQDKQNEMDKMLSYIKTNTQPDAVFFGDFVIRCATKRSVVLDGKGASMLIEGNPVELIQWNKERKYLKSLDDIQKNIFLKDQKKVSYILSKKEVKGDLQLIHSEGVYKLYKIL